MAGSYESLFWQGVIVGAALGGWMYALVDAKLTWRDVAGRLLVGAVLASLTGLLFLALGDFF